jgi:hypothetical protein
MPPRGSGGSGIFLRGEALRAFDDAVVLRDPAGRSRRPSLVPASNLRSERGLLARRPFLLHVRYIVARESGRDFCRATGDDNPIHLAGDVVPGAYTASRALLPIEVLFPAVELSEFSVRFSAVARYDRPQHMAIRCSPAASGASFSAVTTQDGTVVAEVEASARWVDPASPAPAVRRREVSVARLRAVRTYLQSLRVAPHAFFRHAAREGYFYPRSYLAALPSGAMVQQLRGEGGLLNKLSLEFAGGRVPITASALPEVSLERPRARRSFNKVLAAIGDGIRTYVRGTALVLSREAAPPAVVAALFGSSEPRPRLVVEPGR